MSERLDGQVTLGTLNSVFFVIKHGHRPGAPR